MAKSETAVELANPLEETIGYQIQRAASATQEAATLALAQLGLKPMSAVVLHLVHANPGCNQSSIGRALGVQRTNLVPVMVDLENRKLIHRTPADGRSNALHLAEAGFTMIAEIERIAREIDEMCYGHVTPRLRSRIVNSLRETRRIVGDR